jgi:hypothetical protein
VVRLRDTELLILNYPDLSGKLLKVFEDLNQSASKRDALLKNPTGLLDALLGSAAPLSEVAVSAHNRLLYALLSNPDFLQWAHDYRIRFEERAVERYPEVTRDEAIRMLIINIDRESIYRDLAEAATTFADRELLFSLFALPKDALASPSQGGSDPAGMMPGVITVAVVALLLLAIAAITMMWASGDSLVAVPADREDLRRVVTSMSVSLERHALELRESGFLLPPTEGRR